MRTGPLAVPRPRPHVHRAGALALALAVAVLALRAAPAGAAVVAPAVAAPLPLTVTMTSDTALTLDSNSPATAGPHAQFVAFRLTNVSGATISNLTATLSGLVSGIALSGGQGASQFVGSIAAGQSRTVYWFITYPSTFNVAATLVATVTDGAGNDAAGSGRVRTASMISAQAGGQTTTSSIGAGAVVGQLIDLDATFQFKGWKAGDSFNLQPAGNESFPAGCFQLVRTRVLAADSPLSTFMAPGTLDRQYFVATVASSGGGSSWTVQLRYTFKYLCAGSTGTPLPYSNELSGTQLKYSANYGTGGGNPGPIPPAPSPATTFTLAKTASVSQLAAGGTVTYTVTIQNTSAFATTIDSIVDVLPGGATYGGLTAASGVTAANSGAYPTAGATGTVVWRGNPGTSYAIAASGTLTLVYTVTLPATTGDYVNGASAYIGATPIGAASSTVTVGTADVAVAKSGPAAAVVSDTLRYAVTISNVGPGAALRVVARDTLPGGVTFVAATNGGTYAGGVVTWPTLASLAPGTSVVDSVTVVAPATLGSLVNVAAATADTYDPTAANNDGSAAANRVTTSIAVAVSVTPDGLALPIKRLPGTRYSQLFTVANASPAAGSYSLVARASGSPGFVAVDSITGPGISTPTPRSDSALVSLAARSSTGYTVWYTVASGDTASNAALLQARHATQPTQQDTGWVPIRRAFPSIALTRTVSPATNVLSGMDLTYSAQFSNAGEYDASSVVVVDEVPSAVMFRVGSATQSLPAGVTAVVAYSTDAGASWGYAPVSGGCGAPAGYDGCVDRVRWSLAAALSPTAPPSTVSFVARVR